MAKPSALILCLILVLTAGCSNASQPTTAPYPPGNYPYPYPGYQTAVPVNTTPEVPYPMPSEIFTGLVLPESVVVPTPSADSGVVIGCLLIKDTRQPYFNMIYLADTIEADMEGIPPAVAFSEDTNQVGVQAADGCFYFADVKPGKYALALWDPTVSWIVTVPDTQDYMYFDVTAGQVTDLGDILIP